MHISNVSLITVSKKHLHRVVAPKSWMVDKTGGNWAPRSS